MKLEQNLLKIGIKPGESKSKINVYNIEQQLINNNDNIMWVRVRIQGSKLKVAVVERQAPPIIKHEEAPCNLIAEKRW